MLNIIIYLLLILLLMWLCRKKGRPNYNNYNRFVTAQRALMSSDNIGNQPIVLVTHIHSNKLESMWKDIPWSHGEKIVVCDCDRSIVEKFDDSMIQIIVDRKHSQKHMKFSLDQSHLQFKAWDTTISYLARRYFQYAWIIENDVAFDPQVLSKVMSTHIDKNYDFVGGAGDGMNRTKNWYWHKKKCKYACDLELGSLVSFCRVSKRLIDKCLELSQKNSACYLEKLFPSICHKHGWSMKTLVIGEEFEKGFSTEGKSKEACKSTKLPLHKCTDHLNQ